MYQAGGTPTAAHSPGAHAYEYVIPRHTKVPFEFQAKDLPHFEPDIQVSLDDANKEHYRGRKFFLEDAQTTIGVNSDQSYLGRILLSFSDYLGDHRIFADLSSIDYFHPNIRGQNLAAATSWSASYWH